MSFSLTFISSRLFIFLSLVVIFAVVWYYYRKTLPPVSTWVRVLLAVLRGGALFLLAVALFGGVLSVTRERQVHAPVAVLVDVSSSMSVNGGGRADTAAVKAFFGSREWERFAAAHDVRIYAFSDSLEETVAEDLVFTGPVTDIEQALQAGVQALGSQAAALLLISDGEYTRGGDPVLAAATQKLPVYTILSGDSGSLADVMITSMQLSATGLAGHRIPVQVSVRGPGFGGESVQLELRCEDRLLDVRRVRIPAGGFERIETLYFETDRPGFTEVGVRAAVLPGEVSERNNEQTGFINITPGRIRVLLLAAGPHQDTAFTIRTLMHDLFVDLTPRVLKDGATFYEGVFPGSSILKTFDCVVLADMPSRRLDESLWERIGNQLAEAGKPVFIQAGREFDPVRARRLENILPFDGLREDAGSGAFEISLTGAGRIHPVTGIGERTEAAPGAWNQVPPLVLSPIAGTPKPQAAVLATVTPGEASRQDANRPVLLAGVFHGVKSVFLAGTGLFRWSMQSGREGLEPEAMLRSSIRWLTSPETRGFYRLSLPGRVYETGEAVTFTCTAFDPIYRPMSGGQALLALWRGNDTLKVPMSESGNGEYSCTLAAPGTGRWQASVRFSANLQGQEISGRDSTEFFIQPFKAELQRIEPNPEVLRRISDASGGVSVRFSDAPALVDTLRFPQVINQHTDTIVMSGNGVLLVLILLLLFGEWLIRKRKGMV